MWQGDHGISDCGEGSTRDGVSRQRGTAATIVRMRGKLLMHVGMDGVLEKWFPAGPG